MKTLAALFLAAVIAAPVTAFADDSVTGQVTYIGPDGTQLILDRHDAYAVSPSVSLDKISVMQKISADVSDENGTRTIVKLEPAAAKVEQAKVPQVSQADSR